MKYPIYFFSAKWQYRDDDGSLKDNSTSFFFMERAELSAVQLEKKKNELILSLRKKWNETGHRYLPGSLRTELDFHKYDTWMLGWFYHKTYNQFQSQEEAFKDFQEFVDRIQAENVKNGHHESECVIDNPNPYECLMGAEDRWRWRLCDCSECKAGVTTVIYH